MGDRQMRRGFMALAGLLMGVLAAEGPSPKISLTRRGRCPPSKSRLGIRPPSG